MPWWIERPTRLLAGLEGASVALGVAYPLAGLLLGARASVTGLSFGILLIAVTPIAVFSWCREQPTGLRHLLRRARHGWIAPIAASLAHGLGLLAWSSWNRPVGACVALVALAVAAWSFAILRRTRGWISGRLRGGADLRVMVGGATYVLERAPRGARVGGWLTFPEVEIEIADRGPYRSGRPNGRASTVLLLSRAAIRRRLLAHGLGFTIWAVVCVISLLA